MAATADIGVVTRRRRRVALYRTMQRRMGWERYAQGVVTALLLTGVTAYGLLLVAFPLWAPASALALPICVAALFVQMRQVELIFGYVLAWHLLLVVLQGEHKQTLFGSLGAMIALCLLLYPIAVSRNRLGVQGLRGDTLLLDLRERLQADSRIPALPAGWAGEAVVRNAYGQGFSGDFVLTQLSPDQRVLEVVVTDVSGKGSEAGARALQLQGAMGGLLGPMPADLFLPAANEYLLRQAWSEGFATAVHLVIDLGTGEFSLGSAGHPPAVRYAASTGAWGATTGAVGPVLGILPEAPFSRVEGRLEPGDALALYTDGVVETHDEDVTEGIRHLVEEAGSAVREGFDGLAEHLVDAAGAGESDDRACVVIRRDRESPA